MNCNPFKWYSAVGLVALTVAVNAVHAQSAKPMPPGAGMSHGSAAAGTHDMKAAMMKDMEAMQKMQMSGDVDKDFAMMMKMHHQQALTMAEMELANGKSAEMKALAKQIISAQKKEIAQLDKFLAARK